MAKLRITYVHSTIHRPEKQKRIIRALGLRRLNQTVLQEDNPAIRGMIKKVKHLVRTEAVDGR